MADRFAVLDKVGTKSSKLNVLNSETLSLDIVEDVLKFYSQTIIDDAIENLNKSRPDKPNGASATGALESSMRFTAVEYLGGIYSIEIRMNDYFEIVDKGRRPNSTPPPVSEIKKWIIAKRLRLDDGGISKGGYKKPGTLLSKSKKKVVLGKKKVNLLDAVAYKMARKIGKRGIKGIDFLTDAVESSRENLYKDLSLAVKRDITNFITIINPLAEKYKK
jgi:hypothetical protein